MRVWVWFILLAASGIAAVSLFAADGGFSNRIIVHNAGENPVEELTITNGLQSYKVDWVGPGWMIDYRPPLRTDGGVEISYMQNGEIVEHRLSGYLVYTFFFRCEATITDDDFLGGCIEV